MGFAYSVGAIKLLSFGVPLTFVLDFVVLQLLLHGLDTNWGSILYMCI